jgi:DNA-binding PadR family transcriptional regulator
MPAIGEGSGTMAKRRKVGNLLALGLLSMLSVGEPMYPYEMAQTLRSRGKDQSMKINWGSLYTVVQNLEKYGYIESVATEREGRQPERTTYRITDAGLAELTDWMRELLSVPDEAPTRFESALSEWLVLPPDDVTRLLTLRLETLDKAVARLRESLSVWTRRIPRVLLVEIEYQLAMRVAEADWVRGLIGEIVAGTFPRVDEWRRFAETREIPQEIRDLDELAKRGWPEPDIQHEQHE